MYHDQALIPIKTIDFAGGVNVTLGLPFVRTSPDHGTALDIAGTGRADPTSLIAALAMADDMARRRGALTDAGPWTAISRLPPLREVIAGPRARCAQAPRPALPARPQPDAPHRARRRAARPAAR